MCSDYGCSANEHPVTAHATTYQAYEKLSDASDFTASDVLSSPGGARASSAVVTPGPQGYVSATVDPCALVPGAEYKFDLVVSIEGQQACAARPPRVLAPRTGSRS